MSARNLPPWLQEQFMKLQQIQQNLQSIMSQKQHLEMERAETDKAIEELKNAGDADTVYKHAGSIMIKSTKQKLVAELEEKKMLANTRSTVLEKQEARIKETLKEQESNITEMISKSQSGTTPPSNPPDNNPRK